MKVFITGGCKNGKSTFGEKIVKYLKQNDYPLYYLATMFPKDEEDFERIYRHRKNREEYGFETVEIPINIDECLKKCDARGVFLLDSVTALLENEMFKLDGSFDKYAYEKVIKDLVNLLKDVKSIVLVSDYIFSDAEIYESLTEKYRMGLGAIHKKIADLCDVVIEVSYGNLVIHKGQKEFKELYENLI